MFKIGDIVEVIGSKDPEILQIIGQRGKIVDIDQFAEMPLSVDLIADERFESAWMEFYEDEVMIVDDRD